ncbi:MAG: phosphoadenylyl-sulfate reductase [Proteobacteria bacterium]|nr:phosphoadenylyl-sulfate reductase [Pseudomonadota bacterium]MDA1302162.1 phosphoadenylyl-sulfate reductase [Pseudomonadota bacterium]
MSNDYPSPQDVLKQALTSHDAVTISFSGAEDVVLIDMACNISDAVDVFCLDTGRLHPETYRYIERVRDYYGIEISLLSPDPAALQALVKGKGLFSFYEDGHQECCGIRKIEPLTRHLVNYDAWITGQRQDQSPTRSALPQRQVDTAFSDDRRDLIKYNPLSAWSSARVWQYIRGNDVPYNELHDQGFVSIGCEPCTRRIGPNEHERAGRWWWEEATKRECGLHVINLDNDSAAGGTS